MARGINKVILIEDIEHSIEYAQSHRKFSVSREAFLRAFEAVEQLSKSLHDSLKLQKLRTQLKTVFKKIFKKQAIQPQTNNQNSAKTLLLRNKLKPTNDGKDANFDIKAISNLTSFFINLGNLTHVQSQNRAFA